MVQEHSSNIHGTPFIPYKCSTCGKEFATFQNFKLHLEDHEGKPKPRHICDECGQEFKEIR